MSTQASAAILSLSAVIKLLRLFVQKPIPGRAFSFRAALPENVVREASQQPRPYCCIYCNGQVPGPEVSIGTCPIKTSRARCIPLVTRYTPLSHHNGRS